MTTPKQSPKPADDVAAMVETGSPPITTVTLDGQKYVPAALLTRLEAYLRDCEARRLEERDRAEAAEKRNAELEARLDEAVCLLEAAEDLRRIGRLTAPMTLIKRVEEGRRDFLAKIKEQNDADA